MAVTLAPAQEIRVLQRGDAGIRRFAPEVPAPVAQGMEEPRGRILVAGLGPAGLFAAYCLAQQGYQPLVVERGRPVSERTADVQRFWSGGALDPESNVMFGEGGAGTFSDGKLTPRIKEPRAAGVLRDVPPYVICSGNPAAPHGLNLVGLRRHGFSQECLFKLKSAYKALYREGNLVADAGREIEDLYEGCDEHTLRHLKHFHDFVVGSERGVIR